MLIRITEPVFIGFPFIRSSSKRRHVNATRKSPHYHNTLLEAPDGQPLCVCATGKAEWYIHKGLGVKVNREIMPYIISLKARLKEGLI